MPRASIDYLNARRDAKPASGGRVYLQQRNPVDLRSKQGAQDHFERALDEMEHNANLFRAALRELPTVAELVRGASTRNAPLLAPGESADDLEF